MKPLYKILFRGGEEQVLGLIRAIKKIIPVEMNGVGIVNIYLNIAYLYYSKEKDLELSYKTVKNSIPNISDNCIKEILAILLFNNDYSNTDVNTERAKQKINNKYINKVNINI